MPTPLPVKLRAQVRAKAIERSRSLDGQELWALSMGLAAIVLAAVAYFTIGDHIGAAGILAATAAMIVLVLQQGHSHPADRLR